MATTPTNEQGKPMGHVYVDITLINMFSKKSVDVRALADTGSYFMGIPDKIARDLGFDPEAMSTQEVTLADGSRSLRPSVPLRVKFQDRATTCDGIVMGDECVMSVLALEGMGLIVDPLQRCLIPNPKLVGGTLLLGGMSAAVFTWLSNR